MADFYAVTDFDDLRFATVDEAVKNYLDEVEPADRWRTLHVKAYRRMQPDLDNFAANDLITGVVEKWDEELGDPDSDATCLILDADMRALVPLALALLQQSPAATVPGRARRAQASTSRSTWSSGCGSTTTLRRR